MSVIRAFGMEEAMIEEFYRLQDAHTATYFTLTSIGRFLHTQISFIVSIFLIAVTFTALGMVSDNGQYLKAQYSKTTHYTIPRVVFLDIGNFYNNSRDIAYKNG